MPSYGDRTPAFCRQCKGDLVLSGDALRCGACGLAVEAPKRTEAVAADHDGKARPVAELTPTKTAGAARKR